MQEVKSEAERRQAEPHTQDEREAWSARIYREIANEVLPTSVRMKEDVPGNCPSGLLPILDTQVCVKDGRILFHHFSKPMASLEVVLSRSNMSMSSKLSILTQEACRRLRNFSPSIPWDTKLTEVNRLMWQMRSCGYSENLRKIVAKRTLGKYQTNQWNYNNLQRPLYRTKEERQSQLKEDKGT